jgi:hypothetical protein
MIGVWELSVSIYGEVTADTAEDVLSLSIRMNCLKKGKKWGTSTLNTPFRNASPLRNDDGHQHVPEIPSDCPNGLYILK